MNDTQMKKTLQPRLFEWSQVTQAGLELFPLVWFAMEAVTSPDLETRKSGLLQLAEMDAARSSPLVAYTLATRLVEPDIQLRGQVIQILGDVLRPGDDQQTSGEDVRQHLAAYLNEIRSRQVLQIVQSSVADETIARQVIIVLKECSNAGEYLADILCNRRIDLPLRKGAAYLIGEVGYLDALPAIERLAERLESRLEGQQWLPFYQQEESEEFQLLPEVRSALVKLQAP